MASQQQSQSLPVQPALPSQTQALTAVSDGTSDLPARLAESPQKPLPVLNGIPSPANSAGTTDDRRCTAPTIDTDPRASKKSKRSRASNSVLGCHEILSGNNRRAGRRTTEAGPPNSPVFKRKQTPQVYEDGGQLQPSPLPGTANHLTTLTAEGSNIRVSPSQNRPRNPVKKSVRKARQAGPIQETVKSEATGDVPCPEEKTSHAGRRVDDFSARMQKTLSESTIADAVAQKELIEEIRKLSDLIEKHGAGLRSMWAKKSTTGKVSNKNPTKN